MVFCCRSRARAPCRRSRMLMQILEDVLPFLGGLGVLLVGFASGLSVLLNGNGGDFGEPHLAFVSVLNYGLFSEFGKAAG
jgi:hypothetical protein